MVVGENGFAPVAAVHDVVDGPRILNAECSGHRVKATLHDSGAASNGESSKYSVLSPLGPYTYEPLDDVDPTPDYENVLTD